MVPRAARAPSPQPGACLVVLVLQEALQDGRPLRQLRLEHPHQRGAALLQSMSTAKHRLLLRKHAAVHIPMRKTCAQDLNLAVVRLVTPCCRCLASRWGRGPCTLVAPGALAAGTSLQEQWSWSMSQHVSMPAAVCSCGRSCGWSLEKDGFLCQPLVMPAGQLRPNCAPRVAEKRACVAHPGWW